MLTVIAHVTQGNETTEFLYVECVVILPDLMTVEGNIFCSANTALMVVLSIDIPVSPDASVHFLDSGVFSKNSPHYLIHSLSLTKTGNRL